MLYKQLIRHPHKISCVEQIGKYVKPPEKPNHVMKRLKIFWSNRKGQKTIRKGHLENCFKQLTQVIFLSKSDIILDIREVLQQFTAMDSNGLSEPHH